MTGRKRTRWHSTDAARGDDYDSRWHSIDNPHGEADFVMSFSPRRVLDAGCGTGRVAIELAERDVETVGFDLDPEMLDVARRKAPGLRWVEGDATTVELQGDGGFDVVILAGNVMIFLEPGTESQVLANMADHLAPAGVLVTGFSLQPDRYDLTSLDEHTRTAGLRLVERWATWDREPWTARDAYAVSVFSAR